MALQDEVIRILSEHATHRINFAFGRARINPTAFRHVQTLIRGGQVPVTTERGLRIARFDRGGTPPTLYLWENARVADIRADAPSKGLIVHECVHVYIHSRLGNRVNNIDDEVMAFLSQTIYRLGIQGYSSRGSRQRGGSFSTETARYSSTASGRIFDAAQRIVLDNQMLDSRGCTPLFPQDIAPLRAAISSHQLYS
jgi:hypothetical protein